MDFGKFKYEQNKKAQKAKKKQHITHLKEVKLRPKIEEHDYNFKVNHGKNFLEEHDKVKFTVTFRGRELAHPEAGMRLLERVIKDLDGIGVVEIPIRMEGRSMVLLMVPKSQLGKPAEKKPAEKKLVEKKSATGAPVARSATPRAPAPSSAPAAPAATSATKPKP